MYNIGDVIRASILRLLEGQISEPELEGFKKWLAEGDVSKYYFDRLLNLKAVAIDLRTISKEWGRPVDERILDVLCRIYDAQEINKLIGEQFPNFETFDRYKRAQIEEDFVKEMWEQKMTI
jgi:hypothetical protein